MSKRKIPAEIKLQAVLEYLNGQGSIESISKKYGVSRTPFGKWLAKYQSFGVSAFISTGHNAAYSETFKREVIQSYLLGEGSYRTIAIQYKIPSEDTVRRWVLKYNSHEELKAYGTGGTVIMTKGRKTTFEERVEIASYCISHNHNYAETAEKFKVSYQQARNYTVKYEKNGIDALQDNRGKRKSKDSFTELERLRAELKLEKAKREKAEMEASFLKKLDEIERRRG